MTIREQISMSQQLSLCYAENARIDNPLYLSFTSLTSPLSDNIARINGSNNWIVDRTADHFTLHFADRKKHDKIIYLTADTENELIDLEIGYCYVIGGIVDRNRHKMLCANEAKKYNVRTARLPINQYIDDTQYLILTTNQCFQILASYSQCKNWKTAVEKAIPTRKLKQNSVTKASTEKNNEIENEEQNDDQ